MTRINTNVSSLMAQQTLANTNSQLQSALTQLSTGSRINSGSDDPAGLIASQALAGDITNTQQAITNSQTASQMISTADSASGQISTLLNTISGLVTQAAQSGTMSPTQIAANQSQIDSALNAIDRISQTTTFQGQDLLNGNLDFTTQAGTGQNGANYLSDVTGLQINQADLGTTGSMDVTAKVTTAAAKASLSSAVTTAGTAAAGRRKPIMLAADTPTLVRSSSPPPPPPGRTTTALPSNSGRPPRAEAPPTMGPARF